MHSNRLSSFPRLEVIDHETPVEKLARRSTQAGRDIYVKRDDTTPLALGGNKLRKLEFLVAEVLR